MPTGDEPDWAAQVERYARSLIMQPDRLYDRYVVRVPAGAGTNRALLVDVTEQVFDRARTMGWSG